MGFFDRLESVELRYADISGLDLRGVNLRGACLDEADLRGASFVGARFDAGDLEGSDVYQALVEERDELKQQICEIEKVDLPGQLSEVTQERDELKSRVEFLEGNRLDVDVDDAEDV